MTNSKKQRYEPPTTVEPGQVLIAQAFWNDYIYNRAVVLIIDRDELGMTGIIINKSSDVNVSEAFEEIKTKLKLKYGGPFHRNLIGILHRCEDIPEAIHITNDLYWCGDVEEIGKRMKSSAMKMKDVMFSAGFVEWRHDELENELREKKWWVKDIDSDEIFTDNNDALWEYLLIKSGNSYGITFEIDDPGLN